MSYDIFNVYLPGVRGPGRGGASSEALFREATITIGFFLNSTSESTVLPWVSQETQVAEDSISSLNTVKGLLLAF